MRKQIWIWAICTAIFLVGFEIGQVHQLQLHSARQSYAATAPGVDPQLAGKLNLIAFQTPAPTPTPTPSPAPTPSPTSPVSLGATIIGVAALVTTTLQGVKSLFPQISGLGARIIAVVLAIAGAITMAPSGQPPLVTAGAAATAALGSMGIHSLFKAPVATK